MKNAAQRKNATVNIQSAEHSEEVFDSEPAW